MSSSVLCGRSRWVFTRALASIRTRRSRMFSAASSDEPYIAVAPTESGQSTVWPDESMGPFGPQDQRFQLPGNVGFDCHLDGMGGPKKAPAHRTVPDVLTAPSSTERHQFILAQFVNEFQGHLGSVSSRVHKAEQYFSQSDTDCRITSCPELLRTELELLFPSVPSSTITVVTVTHRSARMEDGTQDGTQDERQLLHKFLSGAKEMCLALWTAGYWADFIHPVTGAPFFASPLSSSETDERLRHLGFHIDASGPCTVIRQVLWGTPVFVGTVFTNAPTNSAAVTKLKGLTLHEE